MKRTLTMAERLEFYSIPEPNSGCLLWTGPALDDGRGRLMFKGERVLASRAAWIEVKGPIPDGLDVLHKCDVPACIEVNHLFLGTHQDNMADCVAKGRRTIVRGEHQGNAKLTEAQVMAIRADARKQKDIAAQYGVTQALVSLVKLGKAWSHV